MKNIWVPGILAFIIFSLPVAALEVAGIKDWKLVKRKNQIEIYMSSLDDSRFKGCKAEIKFNETKFIKVKEKIEDLNAYSQWIHSVSRTDQIIRNGEVYLHAFFELPWPIKNRDVVYKVNIEQSTETEIEIVLDAVDGFLPEEDGYIRVRDSQTRINVKTKGSDVNLSVETVIDLGGQVPVFLINAFIDDGTYFSANKLAKTLKKEESGT